MNYISDFGWKIIIVGIVLFVVLLLLLV